jgi:hypothetical protein
MGAGLCKTFLHQITRTNDEDRINCRGINLPSQDLDFYTFLVRAYGPSKLCLFRFYVALKS